MHISTGLVTSCAKWIRVEMYVLRLLLVIPFHLCNTFSLEEPKVRHVELPAFKIHLPGGFPGGAVVENLPANAGDTGLSPGLGRSHMPRSN